MLGKLRAPQWLFLTGFFAGVFLVAAFFATRDSIMTRSASELKKPGSSQSAGLLAASSQEADSESISDTWLSLRVLRERAPEPISETTANSDTLELLVVRGSQPTANLSSESPETPSSPRATWSGSGGPKPPPPPQALQVDPIQLLPDQASVTITGMDTLAPRQLTLWRRQGDEFARVAFGQSDASGYFHFPQVIVPLMGLDLLVTESSTSNPFTSSDAVAIQLLPPLPSPSVMTQGDSIDGINFQLHPALHEGFLLIADGELSVIDRLEIEEGPAGVAAGIELPEATLATMEQDMDCGSYQVAHELEDGRRSGWVPLPCASLSL